MKRLKAGSKRNVKKRKWEKSTRTKEKYGAKKGTWAFELKK